MRQPDVDRRALEDLVARVVPGSCRPVIERAADGVSTPVYRVERDGRVSYLRVAEAAEASLAPEALVHRELRGRGARVPEVVHFEPFDEALGRSVMVTTAIEGSPLARCHAGVDVGAVLRAAGRDLAVVHGVHVAGFGWIERDEPASSQLRAPLPSLRAFAVEDLDQHLAAAHRFLAPHEVQAILEVVARADAWLNGERATLAHGDFDASHVYHRDGVYTGIIDFGEIRGTDRFYDLGHFALHDGETIPAPALPHLLGGYREVTPLPPDHEGRIHLWSVLIGVRALARSVGRPDVAYQRHLTGAVRRALAALG